MRKKTKQKLTTFANRARSISDPSHVGRFFFIERNRIGGYPVIRIGTDARDNPRERETLDGRVDWTVESQEIRRCLEE